MKEREALSFCRICQASCGTRLTLDEGGRIRSIQGDRDNPLSRGYICFKGAQAGEAHNSPERLLRPMKRQPDGTFQTVGLEQALDEIAARMQKLIAANGQESIGLFVGNGAFPNSSAIPMHYDFMRALGSWNRFTTITIDQSAKFISFERMGGWEAGLPHFDQQNVAILFGANPIVSHGLVGMLEVDPTKRLKQARARGMKLIVIDPRQTETARYADLHLQPLPGHDAAIAAGLLRIIFDRGLEDGSFCDSWIRQGGLSDLRNAVEPFEANRVEERAGLRLGDLAAVVDLFTANGAFGSAWSCTGVTMSPNANLSQHLIDCINVVCGRFARAGDLLPTADMLHPIPVRRAQAISPPRSWRHTRPSRIRGCGTIFGHERMTSTLPDEILTPGAGQIRCLIVDGGNPASSVPDEARMIEALKDLDLLVAIEPFMTNTARLAHYILPPLMQYERSDLPVSLTSAPHYPVSWVAYAPAVCQSPPDSELVEDWYVFWAIARRLGLAISYDGRQPLDMGTPPATDDLLAVRATNPDAPFDAIKRLPAGRGKVFDELPARFVQAAPDDASGRFDVMPGDVHEELSRFLGQWSTSNDKVRKAFTHLLAVRRSPNIYNSHSRDLAYLHKREPYNPAYMHPDELAALGLNAGDRVKIVSDHGRIEAIVAEDETVRRGVVSMSHGRGGLPDDGRACEMVGSSINRLVSSRRDLDTLHVMPRMSAIPVNIENREDAIDDR